MSTNSHLLVWHLCRTAAVSFVSRFCVFLTILFHCLLSFNSFPRYLTTQHSRCKYSFLLLITLLQNLAISHLVHPRASSSLSPTPSVSLQFFLQSNSQNSQENELRHGFCTGKLNKFKKPFVP